MCPKGWKLTDDDDAEGDASDHAGFHVHRRTR
jgi:hypothetical protein